CDGNCKTEKCVYFLILKPITLFLNISTPAMKTFHKNLDLDFPAGKRAQAVAHACGKYSVSQKKRYRVFNGL
ncbi:hypothetical protein, partial [Acinetobacter baumannii]|uniref:hypothetical protein n=1 Tax=Acinetobacter baumannii TaxID=470 RepID=UPI001C07393A